MTLASLPAHHEGPLRVTAETVETVDHHSLWFSQVDRARRFYIVAHTQLGHYVKGDGLDEGVIDVSGAGETFAGQAIVGPGIHRFCAKLRQAFFGVITSCFGSRRLFVWHKLSGALEPFVAAIRASNLKGWQI